MFLPGSLDSIHTIIGQENWGADVVHVTIWREKS